MDKIKKVLAIGFAMFLLGVILLSVLSMFSGRAKGASDEYTDSVSYMGEASKEAREALMKECKAKERVRLMFLLDANSGNTQPTEQEVVSVKERLLSESCFFDQAVK